MYNTYNVCIIKYTYILCIHCNIYLLHTYMCVCAQSLQECLTLCDPKDYSPPGSSVRGLFQARILEWVAIPSPGITGEVVFREKTKCMLTWRQSKSLQREQ